VLDFWQGSKASPHSIDVVVGLLEKGVDDGCVVIGVGAGSIDIHNHYIGHNTNKLQRRLNISRGMSLGKHTFLHENRLSMHDINGTDTIPPSLTSHNSMIEMLVARSDTFHQLLCLYLFAVQLVGELCFHKPMGVEVVHVE
jgi:hypothetical protein